MQFDQLKQRKFITLLGGAAAAWPLAAAAQQPAKIAHVGWLSASLNNPVQALGHEVLVSTLRRLGFTEGENLILEHRPADQGMAKAFAGANELVAAKADVLIADGPELALQAATAARPMVPVVMLANNYNPFERATLKVLLSRVATSLVCSTDSRSWPRSNSNCWSRRFLSGSA
jgi:hypothetical protein